MTAHSQKKLDGEALKQIRTRFGIPLSDDEVESRSFYRPPEDSPELRYLRLWWRCLYPCRLLYWWRSVP